MLSSTVPSSTLLRLYVQLKDFSDCLPLLDGRFDQLCILYVCIDHVNPFSFTINDKKKLPNLQVFSLYCDRLEVDLEDSILPLLQRMSNLVKLDLTIIHARIDGNTFKKDIIDDMPQLKQFTFNIYSTIDHSIQMNFPSNEYIQQTFEYFSDKIITCVDHLPRQKKNQYHMYSYPYKLTFYNNITNNFPGGLFNNVKKVSLYDERSFEYEFFLRIAQSFPFMKELEIVNEKPQNNKGFIKSENHNQPLSIIEYPNLIQLHLFSTHDDYLELFLLDTKVSLPNTVHLTVDYESLERVTNNFTRNTTRINCTKFLCLHLYRYGQIDERIKDYFPYAYRY